jgi:hypothetical protein
MYGIVGGYRFCPQTSLSDALSIFVSKFPLPALDLISLPHPGP